MHTTLILETETETEQRERFSNWYDNYCTFEGEPTTITIHEIWQQYGGPEEGGWYFQCGYPIETICIYTKAQAISELCRLHAKYESEEYEGETYDISLSQKYAEAYPISKPYYQ